MVRQTAGLEPEVVNQLGGFPAPSGIVRLPVRRACSQRHINMQQTPGVSRGGEV